MGATGGGTLSHPGGERVMLEKFRSTSQWYDGIITRMKMNFN